jgi:hypothetical protein
MAPKTSRSARKITYWVSSMGGNTSDLNEDFVEESSLSEDLDKERESREYYGELIHFLESHGVRVGCKPQVKFPPKLTKKQQADILAAKEVRAKAGERRPNES